MKHWLCGNNSRGWRNCARPEGECTISLTKDTISHSQCLTQSYYHYYTDCLLKRHKQNKNKIKLKMLIYLERSIQIWSDHWMKYVKYFSERSFPKIIGAWHVCCDWLEKYTLRLLTRYSVDWQNIKYYEQQQGYYYGIDDSTLNVSCKFYAQINNADYKWRFLQEV